MIGTEKQIAYAKAILEGARAFNLRRAQDARTRSYAEGRLAAIDLIRAIDEGRHDDAMKIMDTADVPMWVTGSYVIAASDGKGGWNRSRDIETIDQAVVVASNVIDALKGDFFAAKDAGLIS